MSSSSEARRAQPKKPEQEPDLSVQYRRIGIKAVAAAAAQQIKGGAGRKRRSGTQDGSKEESPLMIARG